jgi:type II secretory pathway pseudopilin PulG
MTTLVNWPPLKSGRALLTVSSGKNTFSATVQAGFILIPVLVTVSIVALVSLVMTLESGMNATTTGGQHESEQLRLLTEAGMQHATWNAYNSGCTGYALPSTSFGSHSYSATFTPTSGSPSTVSVTGTLDNGTSRTVSRENAKIYQPALITTIQPNAAEGKDTYLFGFKPTLNYGAVIDLYVTQWSGKIGQSLVQFDVSGIPSFAKIISADLALYQNYTSPGSGSIGVYRVTSSWQEGAQSPGGKGPGATWDLRDTGLSWTTPGGDYDVNAVAVSPPPSGVGWVTWDISALVNDWITGTYSNNGVLLLPEASNTDAYFQSSDGANPLYHPKLTITYACECGVTACMPSPSTGPIAHWKLDETIGLTASDSEGGHDGTLVNEATWSPGNLDGGLLFDGINDYVNVPHDNNLLLTGEMTFTAWANTLDVSNGYKAIIAKDTPGNGASNYWFGIESDELVFGFWVSGAFRSVTTSGANLTAGNWKHLAASFSNVTDEVLLYIDGEEIQVGSITFEPTTETSDLWIGKSVDGEYWNGTLDDVRIYNRALTAGEIDELYTEGYAGPFAHWKLDDGVGTTAIDSEGGHDGTLINEPTWVVGKLGDALDFDGSDDYVDLTSDAALDDVFIGGATVMAWIEPAGWGEKGYGRIFDKSNSLSLTGDGWVIRMNVDNGGIINFGQGFTGGRGWWKIPNSSINLNIWQHIAVSYDASSAANDPEIYLNGSPLLVTEVDTPSGTVRSDASINLRLGNYAGDTTHTFDGKIDDARIYNRILSATEIADLAASGGSGGSGGDITPKNILLVVGNAVSLTQSDTGRLKWITEWGHTVTILDDGESQSVFDKLVAANDVIFVANSVVGGTLADKLTGANKGIVNEFPGKLDNFGFSNGTTQAYYSTGFSNSDTSHYITSPFNGASISTFSSLISMPVPSGSLSIGLQNLGTPNGAPVDVDVPPPGLATLDVGATRWDGRLTLARRVHLPFGNATVTQMTNNGIELIKRSIEWAGAGGNKCDGNFRDEFNIIGSFAGSDGSLSWSTDWQEVNESDGANSGDVRVLNDVGNDFTLRLRDNDSGGEGAQREADLSAYTAAALIFNYRRNSLDTSDDYVKIEVSNNGGSSWRELGRIGGPATDGSYLTFKGDITSFISMNTRIRFITSPKLHGTNDEVYLDNVEIAVRGCVE